MSPLVRDIRAKAKTATLAGVFLLSFTLYGVYCLNTTSEVKVNGPIYRDIIRSQDVIADILPPPEYLVEACLTAHQILDAVDSAASARLIRRLERLKAEYLERHVYWSKELPPGPMRSMLVDSSFVPAQALLQALDRDFLPAIRAGDKPAAERLLSGKIQADYEAHRRHIDAVVAMGRAQNRDAEARAEMAVRSRTYGQVVFGILLFGFLSFFSSYVLAEERKAVEAARAAEARPERSGSVA